MFVDFEYDEWALSARRTAEQQLIGLFDLLSVQAEDAGDLPVAQALAERALRLDRYTDSRYVRLAELLTLQDRVAAAIAVLDDAAEVAREMGGALPTRGQAATRRADAGDGDRRVSGRAGAGDDRRQRRGAISGRLVRPDGEDGPATGGSAPITSDGGRRP